MKNVVVIFGGESCEHDVSVITGVLTLNAIDRSIYNPFPIYVGKNGKWYTHERMNDVSIFQNINVKNLDEVVTLPADNNLYLLKRGKLKSLGEVYSVVNCCHGGEGEGGGLAGVFKISNIPCTSSSLFALSTAMDKEFTKLVLNGIGVSCLPCVRITRDGFYLKREIALDTVKNKLGFPAIIKPSKLGSSIGISVVQSKTELEKGLVLAFSYDEKVIVEKALVGFREINCGVYKTCGEVIASDCEEVVVSGDMLTFGDKYQSPTQKEFPAKLDEEISEKIKQTAKNIYKKLGFSGVIRIDFLLCNNEIFVNEINSIPGSLSYYLFCKTTLNFCTFLTSLIEESVDDFRAISQNKKSFKSGVLNISSCKTKG